MKSYWETLKNYLATVTPSTPRSEILAAWNTAATAYNADEDIVDAIAAYNTAKADLATKFKALTKLEYEAMDFRLEVQRMADNATVDCTNDIAAISHFADWMDQARTRTGLKTFDIIRHWLEPSIAELQDEGGCPLLDPRNF